MELFQLRYFITIAETQSFTQAAHRLHLSQPALSHQIKQLENELGARLFNRTSRRVDLTQDGRAFLPLAQNVLSKAGEAQQKMKERLGVAAGEVSFGTIPTIAASAVPAHHPLADSESVRLHDLEKEELVMLGGDFALAGQVTKACREAGFEPQVSYETGSMESVKSFVAHDLGIAVVPKLAVRTLTDDRISPVPFAESLTRNLNLIRGKDRHATVAARTLMIHARSTLLSEFTEVGTVIDVR